MFFGDGVAETSRGAGLAAPHAHPVRARAVPTFTDEDSVVRIVGLTGPSTYGQNWAIGDNGNTPHLQCGIEGSTPSWSTQRSVISAAREVAR